MYIWLEFYMERLIYERLRPDIQKCFWNDIHTIEIDSYKFQDALGDNALRFCVKVYETEYDKPRTFKNSSNRNNGDNHFVRTSRIKTTFAPRFGNKHSRNFDVNHVFFCSSLPFCETWKYKVLLPLKMVYENTMSKIFASNPQGMAWFWHVFIACALYLHYIHLK